MSVKKINLVITLLVCLFALCGGLGLLTPTMETKSVMAAGNESGDLRIVVGKVSVNTNLNKNGFNDLRPSIASPVTSGSTLELSTTPNESTTEAIFIDTENNAPIDNNTGDHKKIIIQSVDLSLNGYTLLHNWKTSDNYEYSQLIFGLRRDEVGSKFDYDVENNTKPNTQTGYATTICSYGEETTTTTVGTNNYNVRVYKPTFNDDPDTTYKDQNINDVEGFYEIRIKYSVVGGQTDQTATFNFYMYRTDTFSPANENPTFDNVDSINLLDLNDTTNPKLNYFNFDKTADGVPLYPTLTYNPKKFSINYTYTHYGYIENVRTSFANGILTVKNTITGNNAGEKTTTFTLPVSDSVSIVFDEVGEYSITKTAFLTYSTKTGDILRHPIDSQISPKLLQAETLIINGYTAQYAKTQNENAPLYSNNYYTQLTEGTNVVDKVYAKLFKNSASYTVAALNESNKTYSADFSFALNSSFKSLSDDNKLLAFNGTSTLPIETSYLAETNTEVARTNLPPVSFDYYGRIDTAHSCYAYRKNGGTWSKNNYTANKTFKEAGEYYVFLTYANSICQYKNNIYDTGTELNPKQPTNKYQVFHFFITNEQPQLELMKYTGSVDETFNVTEDNTTPLNQKYINTSVFAQITAPSPFDAPVITQYKMSNDNVNWTNWVNFNCYITDIKNTPTLFTASKSYQVRIFKNQNNNSSDYSVNYSFNIDTSPITNVKAMSVSNNKLGSTTLSSENNFNLIVNQNFAWTWDEKANGNTITAKYVYASIVDNSNSTTTITLDNGKEIVSTNYKLSQFTAPMNYIKPETDSELSSVNQIISNSQVAILMLSDEAGNTAAFITILDKTKSDIFIYDESNNQYSAAPLSQNVKEPISYYWGTHKSIILDTGSTEGTDIYTNYKNINNLANEDVDSWTWNRNTFSLSNNMKAALSEVVQNGSSCYLILPVQNVEFTLTDTNGNTTTVTRTPSVVSANAKNWKAKLVVAAPYDAATDTVSINTKILVDENEADVILATNTTPQNDYSILYDIGIHQSKATHIEVNMDNSQCKMFIDNTELSNNSITNGSILKFECLDSEEFPIESIVMQYYPFDFSANSTYPFSDTQYQVELYPSASATKIGNVISIENLMKQSIGNGNIQSREGKYIIIRKYKSTYNAGGGEVGEMTQEHLNGDYITKIFTYYVDRKTIIPVDTTNYGSQIYLTFENAANNISIKYGGNDAESSLHASTQPEWDNNLFTNIGNDPTMVSTDYDITLHLNDYKYSLNMSNFNNLSAAIVWKVRDLDGNETQGCEFLNNLKTNTTISLKRTGTNNAPYTYDEDDKTYTYRIILFDNANLRRKAFTIDDLEDLIEASPNYTVFTFTKVATSTASIRVVATDNQIVADGYEADKIMSLPDVTFNDGKYYTNKKYVYVVWENNPSPYISQISGVNYVHNLLNNYLLLDNLKDVKDNPVNINNIIVEFTNGKQYPIQLVKDTSKPIETAINLINNDKILTELTKSQNATAETLPTNWLGLFADSNMNTITTFLDNYVFAVTIEQLQDILLNNESDSPRYYYITKSNTSRAVLVEMLEDNILTKEIATTLDKGKTYHIMEVDMAGNTTFLSVYIINDEVEMKLQLSYDTLEESLLEYLLNGNTYTKLSNFKFVRQAAAGSEATYDSWNIPYWMPITITNSVTNSTHTYLLIQQTSNLPMFRNNLGENLTIVNNVGQLLTELNSFIKDEDTTFGAHYKLIIWDESLFSIIINNAGDELDFSNKVNIYLEKTDSTLTFNVEKFNQICNEATFAKDVFVIVFHDDLQKETRYFVENGVVKSNTNLNLSGVNDLVTVTITDNYGRIQKHIIENASATASSLYSTNFQVNRTNKYPITPVSKNVLGQVYQHTIDDFSFEYDKRFDLIVTTTDVSDGTSQEYKINSDGTYSTIKFDSNHNYKFNSEWRINNKSAKLALEFSAPQNAYILITIEPQLNGTTVAQNIDTKFAIYTMHPKASISNKAGSILGLTENEPVITGQPVVITLPNYLDIDYLFNPEVLVIFKPLNATNETTLPLTKNTRVTFTEEGNYIIIYRNSIGTFNPPSENETTFTIRKNIPELYNVTVKTEGNTENFDYLTPVDTKLKYVTDGKTYNITHYIYQHKTLSTINSCLDRIKISTNKDRNIECEIVEVKEAARVKTVIYRLSGSENNFIEMLFAVSCVISDSDKLNNEPEIELKNSNTKTPATADSPAVEAQFQNISSNKLVIFMQQPDENAQPEAVWAELKWNSDYVTGNGLTFSKFYRLEIYEGEYTENAKPTQIDYSGLLKITETGIYNIKVVDQLGRCQRFGESNSSIFTLTILNDVPFYVKDETSENANLSPIPYQTFNNEVGIYVPQSYGKVEVTIKRNNANYTADKNGDMYSFNLPGTYNVTMTGNVTENYGLSAAPLISTYAFTILSNEIAVKSYNFAPISGHKITSVEYLDVNDEWQRVEDLENIYTLLIDTSDEKFEEGEYRINVTYSGAKTSPQNYSFSFWLSNDEPTLSCSRAWGSSSTKSFEISFTPALLYKSVGDCTIIVTSDKDSKSYKITKDSLEETDAQSLKFSEIGVYLIQIVSADGTILSTYRMTIKTPLNAAAIIIIAIGVGAVLFGGFAFFKARRKMKVR